MVLNFLSFVGSDNLSLKDETDITRIPANGTPSYFLINFYGKYDISENSSVSLAVENIGDVDYRVHGSGLNGAGRNFILFVRWYFKSKIPVGLPNKNNEKSILL